MIPVYILLTIIAIGILFLSETGKEILKGLGWLASIGGILYLGFWGVVIAWGFLSVESTTRDTVLTIIATIWVICLVIGWTYKKYKNGEFSKQAIKIKIIEHWKQRPLLVIFWIIMALVLIYSYIKGLIK